MNQSPRQAGSSLHKGTHPHNSPALDHHNASSANGDGHIDFFDDTIGTLQGVGALHDSFDPRYGAANDFGQYHTPHHGFGAERSDLRNRRASKSASPFAAQSDHNLLRGMANYAAAPGTQNREMAGGKPSFLHVAHSPYLIPQMQSAFTNASHQPHPSLQALIDHTAPSSEPAMERQTKYQPFRHLFHDAQQARDHRRRETLFGRTAYIPDDYTIADVESDRIKHVERIYNAMTSGEAARDNTGSIAMKRWVGNAHYPPNLVEAYAHKLFDCLLQQAKEGFRGWEHNDYVADERKGDDVDREVDCAGRLDNIILALEQEKTICEDVMNSACQIRMFVNAPRAYANRKHQNRVGNSKRGRGKDIPDANPRPVKAQRAGGRRARARSSAASEMPSSRDSTPQHQQALQRALSVMPYYSSPASQSLLLSPGCSTFPAPRTTPLHRPTMSAACGSFTQRSIAANPPPTSSPQMPYAAHSHTPRMAIELPFISSLEAHNRASPSTTGDDVKPPFTGNWQDVIRFDEASCETFGQRGVVVDPKLSEWNFPNHAPCEVGGSANMFDQQHEEFVCLSSIEHSQPGRVADDSNHDLFGQYWARQDGV